LIRSLATLAQAKSTYQPSHFFALMPAISSAWQRQPEFVAWPDVMLHWPYPHQKNHKKTKKI